MTNRSVWNSNPLSLHDPDTLAWVMTQMPRTSEVLVLLVNTMVTYNKLQLDQEFDVFLKPTSGFNPDVLINNSLNGSFFYVLGQNK